MRALANARRRQRRAACRYFDLTAALIEAERHADTERALRAQRARLAALRRHHAAVVLITHAIIGGPC